MKPAPVAEQGRVVIQDATLELLHRGREVQPAIDERLPEQLATLERVDLASRAVQRRDLLGAQVLPERFGRHPRVDVGQHLEVPAAEEVCVVAGLDQGVAQLADARSAVTEVRHVRELLERLVGPQCERALERVGRLGGPIVRQRFATGAQEPFGAEQVDLTGVDVEAVAARLGDDVRRVGAQLVAEPRYQHLQRRLGMRGESLGPDRFPDLGVAHDPVRVQHHQGQERRAVVSRGGDHLRLGADPADIREDPK